MKRQPAGSLSFLVAVTMPVSYVEELHGRCLLIISTRLSIILLINSTMLAIVFETFTLLSVSLPGLVTFAVKFLKSDSWHIRIKSSFQDGHIRASFTRGSCLC